MKKCLWILIAAFMLLAGTVPCASAAAGTSEKDQEIINKVVDNLKLLAQVPRPSHHEKGISDYLVK